MSILDVGAGAGEGLESLLARYRAEDVINQRNRALTETERQNRADEALRGRQIDEMAASRADTLAQRVLTQLQSDATKREGGYGVSAAVGPTGKVDFTPTSVPRPEAEQNMKVLGSSALYNEPNQTGTSTQGVLPLMGAAATKIDGGTPGEQSTAPTAVTTTPTKLTQPSTFLEFRGTAKERNDAAKEAVNEKRLSDAAATAAANAGRSQSRDDLQWEKFWESQGVDKNLASNENRGLRSYQFQQSRIDKISKPIEDENVRIAKILTALKDPGNVNDAIVAPEFLSIMAGGAGSGLRMNEAELKRIVGSRTYFEALEALASQWDTNPQNAHMLSPEQHNAMRKLVVEVAKRNMQSLNAVNDASDNLRVVDQATTQAPQAHAKVVGDLRRSLQGINGIDVTGAADIAAPAAGPQQAVPGPLVNGLVNGQWVKGHMVDGKFVPGQ